MNRPLESRINQALTILREEVNGNSERKQSGCIVADIVPPEGKPRSLNYLVARKMGVSVSLATRCIAELVDAGYLQPNPGGKKISRWVRLRGDFTYQA